MTVSLVLASLSVSGQQAKGRQISAADEAEFERAMHMLDAGQGIQARPLLEELNKRHPGNFQIVESLGLLYASAGDLREALPLLQEGARVAPSEAAAHANLGTDYLKLQRIEPAIEELGRAASLNPADAETRNALGQALMLGKQPCKAAEQFTAAQKGASSDGDLVYNTGLALFDCGKFAEAGAALRAMPGLEGSASAQSLLGDAEEKSKNFKDAAEHYLRAAQLDPSEVNLYALGADLLRHWSFDPAIKAFDTGVQRYPESRRMLTGLGIAYYGAAKYPEAIAIFSGLLEKDPNNTLYGEVFGRSCTILTNSDDPHCTHLIELAQQHPANASLSLYSAVAILHKPAEAPQLKLATELLQHALQADPQLAAAHYELGVLLQQQDKWEESVPELQRALALDPKLARAHYRLGLAYRRTGHKEEAQREMSVDREEDQEQRNDLNARMQQITTLLVKMQ